jgi:hypothetical protein
MLKPATATSMIQAVELRLVRPSVDVIALQPGKTE